MMAANADFNRQPVDCSIWLDTEQTSGTVLVNTVEENKSKYTERDHQRALVTRRLQNTIGHKSTADLLHIVKENLLKNCPITTDDIMAAEDMLGTNVQSLRGKQVRCGRQHVVIGRQDVPRTIMEGYKNVTLCIDIMFVNKIPFLVTISRGIKFSTVETLTDRKHPTISHQTCCGVIFKTRIPSEQCSYGQ
jgi:hypothetical protein